MIAPVPAQCPDDMDKIEHYSTKTNHINAQDVCILLKIYCENKSQSQINAFFTSFDNTLTLLHISAYNHSSRTSDAYIRQ